jgi:hypothetical protein
MPSFFLTPKSIILLSQLLLVFLFFLYYLRIKNKSHLSWLITGAAGFIVANLIAMFFAIFPLPNPYSQIVVLWQYVFASVVLLLGLQILYIFPSPTPNLGEITFFARISYLCAALMMVAALVISFWGSTTQIEWLSKRVLYLASFSILASILVFARRIQAQMTTRRLSSTSGDSFNAHPPH